MRETNNFSSFEQFTHEVLRRYDRSFSSSVEDLAKDMYQAQDSENLFDKTDWDT